MAILVLFLILKGLPYLFTTEYSVGCDLVIYGLYHIAVHSLYSLFVEFLSWKGADFCQILLLHLLRWILSFFLLRCYIILIDLMDFESFLYSKNKSHLIMAYDFVLYSRICLANILLRIFHVCSSGMRVCNFPFKECILSEFNIRITLDS